MERTAGELVRRTTHSEGLFPFVRILTNVIVRELQTIAVVLDIYLGVPVIYTTYMQYDEIAHHFGPSSWQSRRDLRRTDARIREIRRMIHGMAGREYDLVILSDHGMTPAESYRVKFRESLGTTVRKIADGDRTAGTAPLRAVESAATESEYEYAAMAPQVLETVAEVASSRHTTLQRRIRRLSAWMRSRYGLRELLLPEKYHVNEDQQVVVTYSSCLALLYFADLAARAERREILADPRRQRLYRELLAHPGIGLIATMDDGSVHLEGRSGRARLAGGMLETLDGEDPLAAYGTEPYLLRAVERLVRQPNSGDMVFFGSYDGTRIVSFDDQVGAHGSAGGDQVYPFLVAPPELGLAEATIEDACDLHSVLMLRYSRSDRRTQVQPHGETGPVIPSVA